MEPKSSKKAILHVFLGIFVFSLLVLVGVLAYQNYQLRQQWVVQSKPTLLPSPQVQTKPTSTLTQESELVSLNNIWNLYTNHKLGFSIKVPKISDGGAPCVWKGEDEGDHSYRPALGSVPVKIFEDENEIYISREYRYNLTGETKEESGLGFRSFFSGCEKEMIALDMLRSEKPQAWNIISGKVANDQELETFIDKHFHPSCRLGEKKPSSQTGVFDVIIQGTNPEMGVENNTCWLNYAYVLKYSPEKQRAYTWDLGQALNFCIDNWKTCYDSEMKDSFNVL